MFKKEFLLSTKTEILAGPTVALAVVIIINSMLSYIGMLEVSVYNLTLTIVSVLSMPIYSYAQASLTIISENQGANNYKCIKKTPQSCLLLSTIFYVLLSAILLLFKNHTVALITNTIGISIAFLLIKILSISLYGIYAGMMLNYIVSSVLFYWRYKKVINSQI